MFISMSKIWRAMEGAGWAPIILWPFSIGTVLFHIIFIGPAPTLVLTPAIGVLLTVQGLFIVTIALIGVHEVREIGSPRRPPKSQCEAVALPLVVKVGTCVMPMTMVFGIMIPYLFKLGE